MEEAKSEIVKFRVTPNELYDIDEKAYSVKLNRSEFLRRLVFEKEVTVYDFSGLDEFSGQIGKIGININQIARKLNMGGQLNKENAEFLKASIELIHKSLETIYKDLQKGRGGG